ncbi:unnamed protein product, partial [Staurois parvus]
WGPRAIGDHGAPVSLPKLQKAYEKGTRGISWGPLLNPSPRANNCLACSCHASSSKSAVGRGGLTTHGAPGQ